MKSKTLPKVGVDQFHYALLETDAPGEDPTYGDVEMVPGTVSIGFNPNSQTASFYADNGVYASSAQTGDLVATAGLSDIPPELRAIWFGLEYEDGVLSEGQINPPDAAWGYRVKKSSGAYRYIWLLKGKAAPPSETTNTQGSSVSFQSDSITINCANLTSLNIYRRMLDDDDPNLPEGVTAAIIKDGWFTSPLWAPEVIA